MAFALSALISDAKLLLQIRKRAHAIGYSLFNLWVSNLVTNTYKHAYIVIVMRMIVNNIWGCDVQRSQFAQKGFTTTNMTIAISASTGASLNQRNQTWVRVLLSCLNWATSVYSPLRLALLQTLGQCHNSSALWSLGRWQTCTLFLE